MGAAAGRVSSTTPTVCTVSNAGDVQTVGVGLCTVTASQNGDGTYAVAAPVSQSFSVTAAATSTAVTVDPAAVVGQPLTVSVAVHAVAPSIAAPPGTVTVDDGHGHTCTTGDFDTHGTASCLLTETGAGYYAVTATYGGNANFLGSSGTASTTTKVATAVTVGVSPNAGVGVPGVLLYAKASPDAATGTVSFTADGATTAIPGCADRPVNSAAGASFGYATCVTTFTTPGAHQLTATFSGDATYAGSTQTLAVPVTPTPEFGQIALGYLIVLAHNLHLFGL